MSEPIDVKLARLETTVEAMAGTLADVKAILAQLSRDNEARIRTLENDLGHHVAFAKGAAWLAGVAWLVIAGGLGVLLSEWRGEDRRQSAALVELRRDIDAVKAIPGRR